MSDDHVRVRKGPKGTGGMISFVWTSASLVAGRKTRTRRDWTQAYARWFAGCDRERIEMDGYTKRPEWGGMRIAIIEIVRAPRLESTVLLTDEDYELEGFAWMEAHPEHWPAKWRKEGVSMWDRFEAWRRSGERLWVVDFEVRDILVSLGDLKPNPDPGQVQLGLGL